MAQRVGKRPGAGRKPGCVSAAKRSLSDIAKTHAAAALKALAEIAKDGESEGERQRISVDAERIKARCQTLDGCILEYWSILEPKRKLKFGWALLAMCRHLRRSLGG